MGGPAGSLVRVVVPLLSAVSGLFGGGLLHQALTRGTHVAEIIETAARAAGDHCKDALSDQCCEPVEGERKGKGGGHRAKAGACWDFPWVLLVVILQWPLSVAAFVTHSRCCRRGAPRFVEESEDPVDSPVQRALAQQQLATIRLVLRQVAGESYVVVTPDGDVFVEDLTLSNDDLAGLRLGGPNGGNPVGIRGASIYALPAFTAARLATFEREADALMAQEAAVPAGLPPVVQPAAAAAAALAPASGGNFDAETLYWMAAEAVEDVKYGDAVANVGAFASEGAKAVHTLPSGASLFVQCIRGRGRESFLGRPAEWDNRVLPVSIDGRGMPECSLKECAQRSAEAPVTWKLSGPRTAKWCLAYLAVEALGLEGHHERFRQLVKVDAGNWGVQEHFQLSMVLKHALQTDQFDGCNNLCIEVIFRRLQTIEYAYADKAREQEAKSVGGRLSLEEQQTFGGLTRQAGTLMVCPDLLDHVRAEVERDANLAKNLRKAKEEREIARRALPKKGAKGDNDS
ncbi:unnamed protein product [Symbiodinium sp. CCMP2592]|nr:unnamed protein product [Symbiodinium sp. CCMP2592]